MKFWCFGKDMPSGNVLLDPPLHELMVGDVTTVTSDQGSWQLKVFSGTYDERGELDTAMFGTPQLWDTIVDDLAEQYQREADGL